MLGYLKDRNLNSLLILQQVDVHGHYVDVHGHHVDVHGHHVDVHGHHVHVHGRHGDDLHDLHHGDLHKSLKHMSSYLTDILKLDISL